MSSRYVGKPLLRILECYILAAIGELQERESKALEQMTNKLQETYNESGSWREIVSKVMNFPPGIDDHFRWLWENKCKNVNQSEGLIDPNDFAVMLVDEKYLN